MSNLMKWVVVLALVVGVTAPLWSEDDSGAPPPQPVVENRVPADFQTGAFDMSGNRMRSTVEEANANLMAQQAAERQAQPFDRVTANDLAARYGAEKVNIDPQTGAAFTYGTQDGRVVTKEEFVSYMKQIGENEKAESRKWLEGAVGTKKQGYRKFGESDTLEINVSDDVKVEEAVNGAMAAQAQHERHIDEIQRGVEDDARRVVPLKTLRSFESNGGGDEQK